VVTAVSIAAVLPGYYNSLTLSELPKRPLSSRFLFIQPLGGLSTGSRRKYYGCPLLPCTQHAWLPNIFCIIQDTNSIARLLDQLSSSTAWQQAVSTQVANAEPASSPGPSSKEETSSNSLRLENSTQIIDEDEPPVEAPSSRVGALLDLLGDTAALSKDHKTSSISDYGDVTVSSLKILAPPDANPRYASFAEALQAVTKLAQRPAVIKHLKEVWLSL
jgi:hypothetical protein